MNYNQKCLGSEKLNKQAFLSMIGIERFRKTNFTYSSLEQYKNNIQNKINYFQENTRTAGNYFGSTPTRIERKLKTTYPISESEEYSPSLTKKYLEKNKNWTIRNFNSFNKEVCVEMKNKSTKIVFSVSIPSQK